MTDNDNINHFYSIQFFFYIISTCNHLEGLGYVRVQVIPFRSFPSRVLTNALLSISCKNAWPMKDTTAPYALCSDATNLQNPLILLIYWMFSQVKLLFTVLFSISSHVPLHNSDHFACKVGQVSLTFKYIFDLVWAVSLVFRC